MMRSATVQSPEPSDSERHNATLSRLTKCTGFNVKVADTISPNFSCAVSA